MALKKPTAKQAGLKKLPEKVRNKFGYMNKGGTMKKTKYMNTGGSASKGKDITLTELRALIKDFYPNLSMKEFNALTKGGMEAKKDMNKGGVTMKKSKMMNKGGASMKKKTKYMSKGGATKKTKNMAKGGASMKKTKYMSRGGAARRK